MEYKHYECESCGYLMRVERNADEPMYCPFCRGSMEAAGPKSPEAAMTTHVCGECKYSFDAPSNQDPPYKCPHCSSSYASAPGRQSPKRF
jgi:DNA-directed RNA polymerase subunit RPC12/RpoP